MGVGRVAVRVDFVWRLPGGVENLQLLVGTGGHLLVDVGLVIGGVVHHGLLDEEVVGDNLRLVALCHLEPAA